MKRAESLPLYLFIRMPLCITVALFIVVCLTEDLCSQVLPFHYYTQSDGLATTGVNVIFQDSRGTIWFATGEGVTAYDGTTFKSYSPADGLAHIFISCITESKLRSGVLWIGSVGGGISKFENGKFTTLIPDSLQQSRYVLDLSEDYTGTLWCVTVNGLYRYSNGKFEHQTIPTKNVGRYHLALSKDSTLYIALENTIKMISPKARQARTIDLNNADRYRSVSILYPDRDGDLWVGTSDSLLIRLSGGKRVAERKIPIDRPKTILLDAEQNLWIGTGSGLLKISKAQFSNEEFIHYTTENGLRGLPVTASLIDQENNLWFANGTQGVLKLVSTNHLIFPFRMATGTYNNCKAVTDHNGHCWAATMDGLAELWKDADGTWHTMLHRIRGASKDQRVQSVFLDSHEQLWTDLNGALVCFKIKPGSNNENRLKKIRTFIPDDQMPQPPYLFFYIDKDDYLWLRTVDYGLTRIDLHGKPHQVETLHPGEELHTVDIRAISQDHMGTLWFGGMANGVELYKPAADASSRIQSYAHNAKLPDQQIRSIVHDRAGRIWIGTRFGGVAVHDRDSSTIISVRDGLLGNTIWSLAEDTTHNRMWIGMNTGVQLIDERSLQPHTLPEEFLGESVTSLGMYKDKFLWYATEHALKIYEFPSDVGASTPPPIHFTRMQVNASEIDMMRTLEFSYHENTVTFEFVGVSFKDAKAMKFQYRLLNLSDWGPATSRRSVTFAELHPGSYTFEVRAINTDGVTSIQPARITFTIVPPFWLRWWFQIFASLCAVSVLYWVYFLRVARLKKEQLIQQEFARKLIEVEETQRKKIAADLHDSLGQNLLIIRNGLQHRINQPGDQKHVSDDLEELSNLTMQSINEVREISYNLHPHQLDRLGLRKAIESNALKYASTSALLCDVHIDNIDLLFAKEIQIHVFRIVQEAMNNIVKHAQARRAWIHIKKNNTEIDLTIEDDGQGFETEQSSGREHGFGLFGIEERVRILKGKYSISSTRGAGTRIHVTLPIQRVS